VILQIDIDREKQLMTTLHDFQTVPVNMHIYRCSRELLKVLRSGLTARNEEPKVFVLVIGQKPFQCFFRMASHSACLDGSYKTIVEKNST
jgi:hypothetical protein